MQVLVITNIFPNSAQPEKATYNRQQMSMLSKLCQLKVIAPIPWFPFEKIFKKNLINSQIPKIETIDGIETFHPRYLTIPRVGRPLLGILFFLSILRTILRIYKTFNFEIIFATWAYPDSFAAVLISKLLKKPILTKVHGSDINEFTKDYLRRKMIIFTLNNSGSIISVSNALKLKMIELGVPEAKIKLISNGINKSKFKQMDKIQVRKQLGLPLNQKIILFVGYLAQVKGLEYLIDALSLITKDRYDILLLLVGDGVLRKDLENRVKGLKLEKFVRFEGIKPHDDIPFWMNACDLFCLPSLNEGCPNVILEALACGKPVVATNVGGIPEIITDDSLGILVPPRDPYKLAEGIITALQKDWDPQILSRSRDDWTDIAEKTMKELKFLLYIN